MYGLSATGPTPEQMVAQQSTQNDLWNYALIGSLALAIFGSGELRTVGIAGTLGVGYFALQGMKGIS